MEIVATLILLYLAVGAALFAHARYPGLPIVPGMDAGATDSLYFRALGIPCYGVSTLFMKSSDGFAHGLNERVPVAGIGASLDQWYSVITAVSK